MQTFTGATGATPPHAAPHGGRHPTALPTLFYTDRQPAASNCS
jgi:hypothetical protein